jgi:hypothetical protein
MKKPLLFIAMVSLCLCSSAQNVLFQDNFDSYTSEIGLAEQSLYWDTWTGSLAVDALVSADTSFSGSNSVKIDGQSNDLILPIGQDSVGSYDVTFKMLITEAGGYFNLLHQWSTTSSEYFWAFDAFFSGDGAVTWRTDGTISGADTVNVNEWFDVKITADMNNDVGYFYVNDSLLHTWQWSLNNDGSPGLNALAAVNFYGTNAANSNGLYYIDDIMLVETSGLNTIESEINQINIWPNPAKNQLTIALPSSTQKADVQIFDGQGRIVYNTLVSSVTQAIDITAMEAGIYTVRVVANNKVYAQPLIVE